jgi:hypothetical protein
MRLSSHQPSFLPWAGYWHKVWTSDLHVMSFGVKYDRTGYQNRVKFFGHWLTAQVDKESSRGAIVDVTLTVESIEAILRHADGRIPAKLPGCRRDRLNGILSVLDHTRTVGMMSLGALNMATFGAVCATLERHPGELRLSFDPGVGETKTDRLLNRVSSHATKFDYLAGTGAGYLELAKMPGPVYKQKLLREVPDASILELICTTDDPVDFVLSSFEWEPVA